MSLRISENWRCTFVSVNIQTCASGVEKKFLWVAALPFKCIEMYIEMNEKRKKNHTTHIPLWVANTPPLPAAFLHMIGLKIQVNIMWNLKWDANKRIHKTETESRTWRTDWWLPRGWKKIEWEVGASRCKLLYREWINSKVLLYSTENCIQYPLTNHDGQEHEKEKNVYTCC